MNDIAIRAKNLSKQYRLGETVRYKTLRESLSGAFRRTHKGKMDEELWALRDVSFEIQHGEVVGVIGRNGAGKSTLLKLLSRITKPSRGQADIYGRVGSLLEVGTGFHPELTGRENIYLNGAILGMKKQEIRKQFDEIVDFSEIEKFLDTPVKRYSSGMYIRLAFAVAAHLEPEILLVDEVLAVGDAGFQKKCLGKMRDVSGEGRTVLFVSHNMAAVRSLCSSALWLDYGEIVGFGEAAALVTDYLQNMGENNDVTSRCWDDLESAPGNSSVRLHKVSIAPAVEDAGERITRENNLTLHVQFWNLISDASLFVTVHFCVDQDVIAFGSSQGEGEGTHAEVLPRGLVSVTCNIPANLLNSRHYSVNVLIVKDGSKLIFRYDNAVSFEVLEITARRSRWYGKRAGMLRPRLQWQSHVIPKPFEELAFEEHT